MIPISFLNALAANAAITIVDTSGANTIQLVDGTVNVASYKVCSRCCAVNSLTNGAVVTS